MSRNRVQHKSIRKKTTSTKNKKSKLNKLKLFMIIAICWTVIISIVIGVMFIYKSFAESNLNKLENKETETEYTIEQFDLSEELNDTKSENTINEVNTKTVNIETDSETKEDVKPTVEITDITDDRGNVFTKIFNFFTGKKQIKPVKLPFEEKDRTPHTIFIDASFGGSENGYITKNGVKAKDITLSLSKKVQKELSKHKDIDVVMSRTEDVRVSSDERIELINSSNADLMVSIRTNGQSSGFTATGIETYFNEENDYAKESFNLANVVQNMALNYVSAKERYILNANFELLNKSNMPSIIIQTGFITTPTDEKNLTNEKYQNELAEGIAQGILRYIDYYTK